MKTIYKSNKAFISRIKNVRGVEDTQTLVFRKLAGLVWCYVNDFLYVTDALQNGYCVV